MFAAMRRLFGRLAVVFCVCSVLLPAAAESGARWNDDPECASDGSSPNLPSRLAAGTTRAANAPGSTHCAICHWLRAIAGAVPTELASTLLGLAPREIVLTRLTWWHDQMLPLARPSRAPPAFSLL